MVAIGRWVAERPMRTGRRLPPAAFSAPALVADQPVEALQAEGEVRAALVAGERVDLVDDHGPDVASISRPRAEVSRR